MLKHLKLAAIVGSFVILVSAPAGAEDVGSSPCAALSGAAWGLCSAGIAVGCHEGKGDPRACRRIEENFLRVRGQEAPWIVPPSECPCDFGAIPKTSPPWIGGASNPIRFQCPQFPGLTELQSFVPSTDTIVHITVNALWPISCGYLEQVDGAANKLLVRVPISQEQAMACQRDIIAYGRELILLNPTVPISDTCTPTIP
jgi:hypothetical protein